MIIRKFLALNLYVRALAMLVLLAACDSVAELNPRGADNPEVFALEKKAIACAAARPDSAEFYLNEGIRFCDSANDQEGNLKMHSLLSELYQYWIISDGLAYYHMNEAINIYLKNPLYRINDPYFYTNLGNIQLKFGLVQEALASYRNAEASSVKVGNDHALILALNNKGLAWQDAGNSDSARYYFIKADHHLKMNDLIRGQNYFYQMQLDADQGIIDRLREYYALIKQAKEIYVKEKGGEIALDKTEHRFFHLVLGQAEGLLADHLDLNERGSLLHLSLRNAVLSFDPLLISNRYIALGEFYIASGKPGEASLIGDTLIRVARFIYNPAPLIKIHAYLARIKRLDGNLPLAEVAERKVQYLQDSLQRQLSGQELLKTKMSISVINANIAVENMKLAATDRQRIISQQKTIIILLLSAMTLILLIVVTAWLLRRKLKFANRMLALKTVSLTLNELAGAEDNVRKELPGRPGYEGLTTKLDDLNRGQKPYLNPSLSLSDLASLAGTNQTYMSAYLNQFLGLNFNDYLNNLRIQHACMLLLTPGKLYSMEQVLELSGFNSKSTFYSAFKKHAGVSPAAFVKMNDNAGSKAVD